MKHISCTIFSMLLIACGGSSSDDKKEEKIAMWDESSQRVQIIRYNGHVFNSNNRYVTYDYSLDSLSIESKENLFTINTVSSPLTCVEDGVTYELIITDETGRETSYLSNNNACNDFEGLYFVDVKDIIALIQNLSQKVVLH